MDLVNGLDANNGLGPDASAAVNKPWKTIAKLLGAAGMASGDTAYLSPAGPFREVVTVAMVSAVAETSIIGDPANAQGFKTAAGVRVSPGDVGWTAYTTDDVSAPSASILLTLAGRDFLTFRNIVMVGGSSAAPSIVSGITTNSVSITFRDCTFLNVAVAQTINYVGLADVASNWTIDRCAFLTLNNAAVSITLPTSAVADYDTSFLIQNCLFLQASSNAINVIASGALAFKGGGVDVLNSTLFGAGNLIITNSANLSTTIPCTAYNNVIIIGTGSSLNANAAGQLLADFNRRIGSATVTNVTPGANDVSGNNQAPLLEIGQALQQGRVSRPFLTPAMGSPILNFGNQAGAPTVDFANRARPAGGLANATGYLERHDTGTQNTGTVHTGASALSITGPGDHDFEVPVDAGVFSVTVYGRYDANHGAGSKPQLSIVNGEECGVVSATTTMTVGVDTWEQITLNITPARAGIITVRLTSRAAAANGIAFWDDFTVA